MDSSNLSHFLPLFTFLLIILSSTKPIFSISISTPSPSLSPNSTDANAASSVHDVLKSHGLPIGIFPKSISGFSLDPISGRFELHVTKSPCDTKFETQVRYDWNVSGIISYGQITELSGVASQELFLWFPVKVIQVDIPSSGLIYFDVGVVSKQFSLSFFETSHDCTAAAELGGDDHDNKFAPPVDLSFLNGRGRITQNPLEKSLKERLRGDVMRAVS